MAEKEWRDLSYGKCTFVGMVTEAPQIFTNQGGKVAMLKLSVMIPEKGSDGGWSEREQIVPILVTDSMKVERTVEKHVKPKRTLLVEGMYRTWSVGGVEKHAFEANTIKLGYKPFEGRKDGDNGNGGGSPFPG